MPGHPPRATTGQPQTGPAGRLTRRPNTRLRQDRHHCPDTPPRCRRVESLGGRGGRGRQRAACAHGPSPRRLERPRRAVAGPCREPIDIPVAGGAARLRHGWSQPRLGSQFRPSRRQRVLGTAAGQGGRKRWSPRRAAAPRPGRCRRGIRRSSGHLRCLAWRLDTVEHGRPRGRVRGLGLGAFPAGRPSGTGCGALPPAARDAARPGACRGGARHPGPHRRTASAMGPAGHRGPLRVRPVPAGHRKPVCRGRPAWSGARLGDLDSWLFQVLDDVVASDRAAVPAPPPAEGR